MILDATGRLPEPAWHADVREAGLDPSTDVIQVTAGDVTAADVALVDGRLVSMTRKRRYGDEIRFRFYAGRNEYGSLVVPAGTIMTVVRPARFGHLPGTVTA